MIYVFDTGPFIVLKNFYPSLFPSLWTKFDAMVEDGGVRSVKEVLSELHNHGTDSIQKWAKAKKRAFRRPGAAELAFVGEILKVRHFQALISQKAILQGTPVADPFVIAAAYVAGGTVVTEEQPKPGSAKIPIVCEHFGIGWMNLETFMAKQGWRF